MKKTLILMVSALLVLGLIATGAFAENPTVKPPQFPQGADEEYYQEMWDYCHGENGIMNDYYGNNGNAPAPQGFNGGGMMRGMMGW